MWPLLPPLAEWTFAVAFRGMLVLPWTKNQVSVEVHGIGIWYIGQGGINEVVLFILYEDCSCFYTIS